VIALREHNQHVAQIAARTFVAQHPYIFNLCKGITRSASDWETFLLHCTAKKWTSDFGLYNLASDLSL